MKPLRQRRAQDSTSWLLLLLLLVTICFSIPQCVVAADEDSSSSKNPYYSGCLQAKLGDEWTQKRTCNSDDPPDVVGLACEPPQFDNYLEIRTQIRNWDSITVLSWLTQIILSELLGVPTTIEAGPEFSPESNFYAPHSPITLRYNSERYYEVVGTPTELPNGDCRLANHGVDAETGDYDWQYCAHFIAEVWDTDGEWMKDMILEGKAEPSQGVGILGKNTWFVTKFTADADPTLDSYHGLVGEANRRKLAETFARPTTWAQYCHEVSTNNCTLPDEVAKRAPLNEEEGQRMFFKGQFSGHFRNTTQNDCDTNPTTCTGHIGNFPCTWQSRMSATLYHLDIALSNTDGPNDYGSYTVQQQIDMWDAANATRNNLIMLWWTPEPLYHRYLGSDAELQRVQLTPVTSQCMEARWESVEECSDDLMTRVGSTTPLGVCEEPPRLLQKVMSGNLFQLTQQYEPAIQSPAYDMLRRFSFSEHQLGEIFQLWQRPSPPHTPRDAVCEWAANNLQFLKGFVPHSYPRVAQEEPRSAFSYVLIGLASFTTLLVLVFSWQVYVHKQERALRYAQIGFLWLLLTGSLLVGIGSILNSLPATNATCVATIWFINIGYTLELVPLIVKVAAINQMMAAARRMSRITLARRQLYGAVAIILACCIVFLAIWTIFDPPQKTPEYSLSQQTTEMGETIVGVQYYCQGSSLVWQYVAVGWNTVLLMCAAVLAFQTRSIVKTFNESGNLAILITSHFFFVLLRCGTFLMSDIWKDTLMIQVRSLLYSVDTMSTLLIYFLPKLLVNNDNNNPHTITSTSFHGVSGDSTTMAARSGSVYISGLNPTFPGAGGGIGAGSAAGTVGRYSRSNSSGALSLDDEMLPRPFVEPLETYVDSRQSHTNNNNNKKKMMLKMMDLIGSKNARQITCQRCGNMCPHCAMAIATEGDSSSGPAPPNAAARPDQGQDQGSEGQDETDHQAQDDEAEDYRAKAAC